MKIIDMLNKYYSYSPGTKSENQCDFERKVIKAIMKCLDALEIVDTEELTEDAWYEMIDWYQNVNCIKNNTIKKRLSLLRTALKYFRIQSDFLLLNYPRNDSTPFLRFQDNELELIFEKVQELVDQHPDDPNYKILAAIPYILLDTGLRNTELFKLTVDNVDLFNKFIFLDHTKNQKKEPVLFSEFSKPKIAEIIQAKYHPSVLFWDVKNNEPMTFNKHLRPFFMKLSELTGIRVHIHRFRKAFGTAMYTRTKDWRFTSKALRHTDIRTSQIYVSESLEFVRDIYDIASETFLQFIPKVA